MTMRYARTRRTAVRGIAAATAEIAVATMQPAHATTSPTSGPGCQPDRRTVITVNGVVLPTAGTWVPCLVDTGMQTIHSGLGISRSGALIRSVAPTPTSVAVSTDNGKTWARRPLPSGASDSGSDGYLDPATNRYYYFGFSDTGDGPVYYTDNRGLTWHVSTFSGGLGLRFDWPRMFAGRPLVKRPTGWPTNVYSSDWPTLTGEGGFVSFYKSTDGGATFTNVSTLPPPVCVVTSVGFVPGQAFGRGIVDPKTGVIYQPVHTCGAFYVYVSQDEEPPGPVTW